MRRAIDGLGDIHLRLNRPPPAGRLPHSSPSTCRDSNLSCCGGPRRKWKRLNDKARAQEVARYSAGDTTTALAKDYDVAKPTIIGILRANNVVVRCQPMTATR